MVSRPSAFGAIAGFGADVVCLQEVDKWVIRSWWADQTSIAARRCGLGHSTFLQTRPLGPFGQYGIAMLSRWPLTSVRHLWLQRHGGEQRGAIIARVLAPGGGVTVVNTHPHNREDIAEKQLAELLAVVSPCEDPVVLAGDFNAGEAVVGPILASAGFVAVSSGPTFPSEHPTKRIDWIAHRGLDRVSVDGGASGTVHPGISSDHRALSAHIVYNYS